MTAEFEIRGEGATIRISINGYERPDARGNVDGNWLNASAHIAVWGFRAEFPYDAYAPDLARFLTELEALCSSMKGTATYCALENDITLEGTIDSRGGVEWSGIAQNLHPFGAKLEFRFRSDQSYLPDLISQMAEVLNTYPIRGQEVREP